jgi:glycosyltransferase involved in cell wall biosynthesis
MRALLVNKFFFPRGGAERAFFEMDAALTAAGHATAHFALRDARNRPSPWADYFPSEASFEGGVLDRATLRGVGRLFYSREVRQRLGALVEAARPDVAVLHNVYHQLGPAVLLELRARRVPTAMVLHDYKVACPAYSRLRDGAICEACAGQRFHRAARFGCGGSRVRGILLAAESYWQWRALRTYAHVARFLAPSRSLADTVRRMGFPFPVEVVPNAIRVPAAAADPAASTAVGFAGRLAPEKGVDVLLRAAARLPHVAFRVAGDGPLDRRLAAEVARRGLGNVRLLGRLDEAGLEDEMRRWRLAVVPSIFAENAPYAVLEPLALGLPVIASDVGGIPELLDEGRLLVRPGDDAALARAVEDLWSRPEECRRLGAAGRARVVRHHAPGTLAARLEAILRAMTGRGGAGSPLPRGIGPVRDA